MIRHVRAELDVDLAPYRTALHPYRSQRQVRFSEQREAVREEVRQEVRERDVESES